MNYFLYWIDKYQGGYIKGVSHAVKDDGNHKSLCGRLSLDRHDIDGGYMTVIENEGIVSCKLCQKIYNNETSS